MKKSVRELLNKIYGHRVDIHLDLYELSNKHRRKHGWECDLYPSDPLQSPLWSVIAAVTGARRALEVGCGHGFTAAVLASALGPRGIVDTVEFDPDHADLAEEGIRHRGLTGNIRVLRGLGREVLPRLKSRYDVVFLDCDWREYPLYLPHLRRLTRRGSLIVTANLSPLFGGWGSGLPGKKAIQTYLTRLVRDRHFRTYIVPNDGISGWHSISVRV